MNVIETRGLCKRYDAFSLDNLDLNIQQGTITGLVGANGAGKSTTIKLILNLIRRDGGTVTVFGEDNVEQEAAVKQRVGVVFDEPCFHELLTARQVDGYMRYLYPNWDGKLYADYLTRFSLPAAKPVKEFSRGMKMKLSIAAALAHNPQLLILDEPTSGLDPVVREEILDMFLDFIQDDTRSILLSSHITTDLDKIADSIVLIHEGRKLFHEEKDVLRDKFLVVKGPTDLLDAIPADALIGVKKHAFGFEAMTADRSLPHRFSSLASERPGIEEIMLFHTRRSAR